MSPFAQAALIEARKLVTQVRVSLECVDHEGSPENGSDDISEDSGLLDSDHGLETQDENNVLYQDNKPVNGIKFPPSQAIDFQNNRFSCQAINGQWYEKQ